LHLRSDECSDKRKKEDQQKNKEVRSCSSSKSKTKKQLENYYWVVSFCSALHGFLLLFGGIFMMIVSRKVSEMSDEKNFES
jgi:hypothetical protein